MTEQHEIDSTLAAIHTFRMIRKQFSNTYKGRIEKKKISRMIAIFTNQLKNLRKRAEHKRTR